MSEPAAPFKAPIGTHDVLGPASASWEGLVAVFAQSGNALRFLCGIELIKADGCLKHEQHIKTVLAYVLHNSGNLFALDNRLVDGFA